MRYCINILDCGINPWVPKVSFPFIPTRKKYSCDFSRLRMGVSVHSFCSMLKQSPVPHYASPTSIPNRSPSVLSMRDTQDHIAMDGTWTGTKPGEPESQESHKSKELTRLFGDYISPNFHRLVPPPTNDFCSQVWLTGTSPSHPTFTAHSSTSPSLDLFFQWSVGIGLVVPWRVWKCSFFVKLPKRQCLLFLVFPFAPFPINK